MGRVLIALLLALWAAVIFLSRPIAEPENPFEPYALLMPNGSRDNVALWPYTSLRVDMMGYSFFQDTIEVTAGPVQAIIVSGYDRTITYTMVKTRQLELGVLVGLWGSPERVIVTRFRRTFYWGSIYAVASPRKRGLGVRSLFTPITLVVFMRRDLSSRSPYPV